MPRARTSSAQPLVPLDSLDGLIHTIRGERVIAPSLPKGHPLRLPFNALRSQA